MPCSSFSKMSQCTEQSSNCKTVKIYPYRKKQPVKRHRPLWVHQRWFHRGTHALSLLWGADGDWEEPFSEWVCHRFKSIFKMKVQLRSVAKICATLYPDMTVAFQGSSDYFMATIVCFSDNTKSFWRCRFQLGSSNFLRGSSSQYVWGNLHFLYKKSWKECFSGYNCYKDPVITS